VLLLVISFDTCIGTQGGERCCGCVECGEARTSISGKQEGGRERERERRRFVIMRVAPLDGKQKEGDGCT
jgi:hypothetical protein